MSVTRQGERIALDFWSESETEDLKRIWRGRHFQFSILEFKVYQYSHARYMRNDVVELGLAKAGKVRMRIRATKRSVVYIST